MNDKHLRFVASNMNSEEFKSFCKGAAMYFCAKSIDEKCGKRCARLSKTEDFFDSAFDKYKHLCDK